MKTLHPTNIGFTPKTYAGQVGGNLGTLGSTFTIGRDVSLANDGSQIEGFGFGDGGRPDYVNAFIINITTADGKTQQAQLNFNVTDLVALLHTTAKNVGTPILFSFKEVSVCEYDTASSTSTEKRMIVMASETYTAST